MRWFILKLQTNFNKDYSNNLTVIDIFDRCKELSWIPEQFKQQVELFLDTQVYDVFTRANFFKAKKIENEPIKRKIEKLPDFCNEPIENYRVSDEIIESRKDNFKKRLKITF